MVDGRALGGRFMPLGTAGGMCAKSSFHAKGYFQEHFTDVFRRYIPKSEVESLKAEMNADASPPTESSP
jgi:hypothetical protein